MKAKDLREQTVAQLEETMAGLRREKFKLRLQKGGDVTQTHPIRAVRRNIARVLTVLRQQRG